MTMSAQLQHLAQAYFHQDYDLEFSDPDEAVVAFVDGEGPGAARELAFELGGLLESSSDELELTELWIKTLGAAYDPTADGRTLREWFSHVRERLRPSPDLGAP